MITPENAKPAFQTVLEDAKTISEIFAIFVGGFWAYYRFFRGRTFRPRLEFLVSASVQRTGSSSELLAYLQMKNVGLSKVEISQRGSGLRVFRSLPASPDDPTHVRWERLVTLPVFENHAWIEPSETIKEQMLLRVVLAESTAVKCELRIVSQKRGRKIEWNECFILPLIANASVSPNDNTGENAMAPYGQDQQFENSERTKRIEQEKLERQKREDEKETRRIEQEKQKEDLKK